MLKHEMALGLLSSGILGIDFAAVKPAGITLPAENYLKLYYDTVALKLQLIDFEGNQSDVSFEDIAEYGLSVQHPDVDNTDGVSIFFPTDINGNIYFEKNNKWEYALFNKAVAFTDNTALQANTSFKYVYYNVAGTPNTYFVWVPTGKALKFNTDARVTGTVLSSRVNADGLYVNVADFLAFYAILVAESTSQNLEESGSPFLTKGLAADVPSEGSVKPRFYYAYDTKEMYIATENAYVNITNITVADDNITAVTLKTALTELALRVKNLEVGVASYT